MKSICFTGHRILRIDENLIADLHKNLIECINNGATDFYAGGAIGWDMLCEKSVLEIREKCSQIKLHLILPCPPHEQTSKWNILQKAEYEKIIKTADSVEILSTVYYSGCMKLRNARLVQLSDLCICYYNDKRNFGGTAQTVRMAQKKGIDIINLFQE